MGQVHRISPASTAGARILTYEFIAQIESAANSNNALKSYLAQKVGGTTSDLDRLENAGADAVTAEMVQEMGKDVNRLRAKVGYGSIGVGAPELKDQKDFVEKGAQEVLERVQRGEFKTLLTETDIARLTEITEKMRRK
jgi:RNA-binding protein YhbY